MIPQSRGFIALMSAIVVSAVLFAVIIAGSLALWNSRFSVLEAESKERSSALADACVDILMLRLSYDATYGGGETIPVGSDDCHVLTSPNPTSSTRTFPVQAVFNHAYTNLLIQVRVSTLTILSWQEVGAL